MRQPRVGRSKAAPVVNVNPGLSLEACRVPENLPRKVLPVLLCVEHPPAVEEGSGNSGSEQPRAAGVAVRDVNASNFVVAFILEAGQAQATER